MATRPTDFVNRSQLVKTVAQSWQTNFSTYTVNFISLTDFVTFATDFSTKVQQNNDINISKKDNSDTLKSINKEIKKNTTRLKEYIRDEYASNIDAQYAAFGLGKDLKGTYAFASDNDKLMTQLVTLVNKLNEVGNPVANRNLGLAYWTDIAARHAQEWTLSKTTKSNKAQLSQDCRDMHKRANELLSKLYRQISIDYPRDAVASTRRSFGFLNEVYK